MTLLTTLIFYQVNAFVKDLADFFQELWRGTKTHIFAIFFGVWREICDIPYPPEERYCARWKDAAVPFWEWFCDPHYAKTASRRRPRAPGPAKPRGNRQLLLLCEAFEADRAPVVVEGDQP
jgi:hypothetical protein